MRRLSLQQRLERTRRETEGLRARTRPEARRMLTAAEAQVQTLLRPDQAARFDRLLAERKALWQPGSSP